MKKYFIFAAIATAGLFASCSSSDDAISEGMNPVEDPNAPQAIRLNLATPGAMTTRGTGTVGGVGTGAASDTHYSANAWAGQRINVFMFTKDDAYATTLNLTETEASTQQNPVYFYDNLVMITPGTTENLIDAPSLQTSTDAGEAMIEDGTINYYPATGNYDFFGYHADDAVTDVVDKLTEPDNLWTVPFTINGTQDLMSTKAELTAAQDMGTNRPNDYYSAYSARKGVQPTLTFKHLLTRLQFNVVAGNDAAAGLVAGTAATYKATDASGDYADETAFDTETDLTKFVGGSLVTAKGDADALNAAKIAANEGKYFFVTGDKAYKIEEDQAAVPAAQNVANAVKVTAIKVLSENTEGNLAVAWTGDKADYQKITWKATQPDEAYRWLTLMERPYAKRTSTTALVYTDFTEYNTLVTARNAIVDQTSDEYAEAAQKVTNKENELDALLNLTTISEALYNRLVAGPGTQAAPEGKGKFEVITAEVANNNLTVLTPTYPAIDATKADKAAGRYPGTKVGESIILSPGAYTVAPTAPETNYAANTPKLRMKVSLEQNVPINWNDPNAREPKTQEYELEIAAPAGGFKQNTSYNIILTVYGLERIEVIAVVEPWDDGGNLEVGED